MRMASRVFVLAAAVASIVAVQARAAEGLRDPTRPPGAATARPVTAGDPESDLVLQSVLIAPERRSAIINGRLVIPGDSVAGYRVAGIAESEVVLASGGDLRTLRLFPAVDMLSVGTAQQMEKRKATRKQAKPARPRPAADGGKS